MEKIIKSDSRISIILSIQNIEKEISYYESLFSFINKSKSDIECVLIDNASTDQTVSKIEADKSFAELLSKGRVIFLKSEKKITLGNAYALGLNAATGKHSLVVEKIEHINIGNLITAVSSHKKNIKDDEILVGSNNLKISINKNEVSQKRWLKLYNSAVRFWTPINLRDSAAGIFAVKTETAAPLFETTLAVAQKHLEILHLASCNGITLNEFAVNTDKKTTPKGFGDILMMPLTAFILRWRYFVSGALHEMKLPEKVSLVNGNNPVYRFTFFTLILLASFAMPYLSKDFGMTWDEKQHNDYSKIAVNYLSSMGDDSAAIADSKSNADYIRQAYRFYGEQCNIVAAIIYKTFDLPEFETRHVVISLYGLLGLIFIALAVKEIAGWRAGIIAILFTFFNPGWLGNSMNNPTDIPFATGFAVSMYFIIKILKALPKPKLAHLIWLGIGIGIGIGSRVGAFLIIAYFGRVKYCIR